MVRRMVATSHITGGYFMPVGNEFTRNTPIAATKRYLDRFDEWGHR
jgi:hypothetical protein